MLNHGIDIYRIDEKKHPQKGYFKKRTSVEVRNRCIYKEIWLRLARTLAGYRSQGERFGSIDSKVLFYAEMQNGYINMHESTRQKLIPHFWS